VGFRPFVARLATRHRVAGWVRNTPHGVEIHVEGPAAALSAFVQALGTESPPAAHLESVGVTPLPSIGLSEFRIRESDREEGTATTRVAPDLPVCGECLEEMLDVRARRFEYPYINCTNCGPRYSLVTALPYDRARTTMAHWPLCSSCGAEYRNPDDRRFHAEPIACPACGPRYRLVGADMEEDGCAAIRRTARILRDGSIVAIKGVGGYHLACDARSSPAVAALRTRKYRKSRPFAVMAKDLAVARSLAHIDATAEALITSPARPIVLMPSRVSFDCVSPNRRELGVMLPYAPIHHLLFRAGAPDVLVMTSANRSSEPIAYDDADALERLGGIADAFLIGERPIARRVDDSVVRATVTGPTILRRSRGYAPDVVATLATSRTILALGADLKNSVALVVGGDVVVSQHIGDLEHLSAFEAFRHTIQDLLAMYDVRSSDAVVVHDAHPEYRSTAYAMDLPAARRVSVQHHRAHIASVLAERRALDVPVVGVAFDGTGHGDDGAVWGGEFFVGSVAGGFSRAASLRPFLLLGGDAAARWPMQAAAGVLHGVPALPDLSAAPFGFTTRYSRARQLADVALRTSRCTSAGRLFDAAAAILGYTGENGYEAQAAEWLEQLAWRAPASASLPYEMTACHIDFVPTLRAMIERRIDGHDVASLARGFHEAVAAGVIAMASGLCEQHRVSTVVISGGTFQNALLFELLHGRLPTGLTLWTNSRVPANDGGISLGQAAIASVA
jgi:hydrogenase maturation protein HypF